MGEQKEIDMGTRVLRLVLLGAVGIVSVSAQASVTVSPTAVSVHLGTFLQFADKVTGVTPATVGWTVALPAGATGSPGTISAGGRYTPPAAMPNPATVIVTVASLTDPAATASATVTLLNPYPAVASVSPANLTATGPFTHHGEWKRFRLRSDGDAGGQHPARDHVRFRHAADGGQIRW